MREKVVEKILHLVIAIIFLVNSNPSISIFASRLMIEEDKFIYEKISGNEAWGEEISLEGVNQKEQILNESIDNVREEEIPDEKLKNKNEEKSLEGSNQGEHLPDEAVNKEIGEEQVEEPIAHINEINTQKNAERIEVTINNFDQLASEVMNAGNIPTTIIISSSSPINFTSRINIETNQDIKIRASDPERSILARANVNGHFNVNGKLTLEDVILDGNQGQGGVQVLNGGNFIMNDGTIIQNSNTANPGGGVRIGDNSTFTMNGGIIRGNRVGTGGGVYVGNGTFIMLGGAIIDNFATTGGGVDIGSGSFVMEGGEIRNNRASNGGGVRIAGSLGNFVMIDGVIKGNEANNGGGIQINVGSFVMEGGEISENRASNGGGVRITGNVASFTMIGGVIKGNEANNGGGVESTNGTFRMEGGKISGHTVSQTGGGMRLTGALVRFTMTGGIISDNEATTGGGVYMNGGRIIMEGGEISNNKVLQNGGGVRLTGSTVNFTMTDGMISDNEATNGGGIEINNGAFVMEGGVIQRNEAIQGGGVMLSRANVNFTLNKGIINENEAMDGGGIFIGYGRFNMRNGSIIGNNAWRHGGGMYTTSIINIEDGGIINNEAYLGGGIFTSDADFLTTSNQVWFEGNVASIANEFMGNPSDFPNIRFANTSIGDHVLNNYDINHYTGALWFSEVSHNLFFEGVEISGIPIIARRINDWTLSVRDTRKGNGTWRVMATLSEKFTNEFGKELGGALVYIDRVGNETIMEMGMPVKVFEYTTTDTHDVAITWDENNGVLLRVNPSSHIGEYKGAITWTLVDAP